MNAGAVQDLGELLRGRSQETPDRWAYSFLANGEQESARITYGDLDRQARAIAVRLRREVGRGERALLLYPSGLEFIAAFFGCLYAGVVAVPAYPPRPRHESGRLRGIVEDSRPAIVLTTSALAARWSGRDARPAELAGLDWLATDKLPAEPAGGWQDSGAEREAVAFLQYTSGSTSTPKGVVITHGNLLANEEMIRVAFEQSAESVIAGWLPLYHDMGLIGNVLQPLYVGAPCVLMSPLAFLQSPVRWLRAVSAYGATTSGGPSFAYELCVRRIAEGARRGLDLSRWQVAFNGAEPVRADTLDRFAAAFAPYGFRREAFYPCYGLAEATLLVSGGDRSAAPVVRELDARSLEQHRAVAAAAETPRVRLVGCGRSQGGQTVAVVSSHTLLPCADGEVGEIWVAGPAVAGGYWERPEASAETFGARLASGEGPFLRTGDLGFLEAGELFVTGRSKDLIIVRGRNHYPQDLELTAERSAPVLRPGCGAAFTVEVEGEERLVLVQEVERGADLDPQAVAQALREAVSGEHEIHVHQVVLIQAGSLPKTSSGKVQRHACRRAFLEGRLETVAVEAATAREPELPEPEDADSAGGLQSLLRTKIARALGTEPRLLSAERPLAALGLDSLMAANLKVELEAELGVEVPLVSLLEARGLEEIAGLFLSAGAAPAAPSGPPLAPLAAGGGDLPLSYGQQALWFLHRVDPESVAYNIAAAAELSADLDPAAFGRALRALSDRHAALRTTFPSDRGDAVQRIHPRLWPDFDVEDARDWSAGQLEARIAGDAWRPFSLETGPLLRVRLFRRGEGRWTLLLAVHHIVADFWSLATLLDELGRLVRAETAGEPARLAPLPLSYGDWVDWQRRMIAGRRGDELWDFWRQRLGTGHSGLDLPFDRPRPAAATFRGDSCRVRIGLETTEALAALGRSCGATLYMTLLAAFQALLMRWTGQQDIAVGSPCSGRADRRLFPVVGYFVNLLVVRTDLGGEPAFAQLLERVRRGALDAFAHQDYPFALLTERLNPARETGRSALVEASFNFLRSPAEAYRGLEAFAAGATGARAEIGGWSFEVAPLSPQASQFELMLVAAEVDGELALLCQYASDLFDAATAERMLGHFVSLLGGVAGGAERPLSELPLLSAAERDHLLAELNQTAVPVPRDLCVHETFEAWAERAPDAPALVFEDHSLTYGELAGRAAQLAQWLVDAGVVPGEPVGLFVERSAGMVVGMLGILRSGGAYLPLDPSYPEARIAHSLEDSGARRIVTRTGLASRLPAGSARPIFLDSPPAGESRGRALSRTSPAHPAYLIYTSGSTGRPKGVVVPHRTVVNFFAGMDAVVGCGPGDTMLAVTSIAFDISVLELLWPLGRGAKVVLMGEQPTSRAAAVTGRAKDEPRRPLDFSLFYFASSNSEGQRDKYRLLLEGARFADRAGMTAVWTPERHFHAFGGPYPSPSVTAGALAVATERLQIRAGSVVLPLHSPIRVAEEWSVVDNLSGGRAGIAFASGWHADDFVFAPQSYTDRKEVLFRGVETVRRLWRGEKVRLPGGSGSEVEIGILPRPLQPELPIWITSAGNAETFVKAGEIGANVLTHLLGQSFDDVAAKVRLYRDARERSGLSREGGTVTLMLHTFVGEDRESVRATVRGPFIEYLRSSVGLIRNLIGSLGLPLKLEEMSPRDMDDLLAFACDRYFETSGLFGTVEQCLEKVEALRALGIGEVACLIDFGIADDEVLASLPRLAEVARRANARDEPATAGRETSYSLAAQMERHRPTLFQCTPSMLRMIALEAGSLESLRPLRTLLLGGEALPPALARQIQEALPARLINVYGPTETTIWSAALEVSGEVGLAVPLGRPIANTEIHVLDRSCHLLPLGVAGEICIGGEGVAAGYRNQPGLTAERFIPDPFAGRPGGRLYRTGDLGVWRADGALEFRGRTDRQVKIRGVRIELEEIEAHLGEHSAVREVAVKVLPAAGGEVRLGAYVVPDDTGTPAGEELRDFLRGRVPEAMVPAFFMVLADLPRTPNGKIDRRALPAPDAARVEGRSAFVAPRTPFERRIAEIWREVLALETVGVDDNFFDLGGHSLLMAQVHSRLREVVERDLPLVKLLEHPTISALSRYLREGDQAGFSLGESRERALRQQQGRRRLQQRAMEKIQTS